MSGVGGRKADVERRQVEVAVWGAAYCITLASLIDWRPTKRRHRRPQLMGRIIKSPRID